MIKMTDIKYVRILDGFTNTMSWLQHYVDKSKTWDVDSDNKLYELRQILNMAEKEIK